MLVRPSSLDWCRAALPRSCDAPRFHRLPKSGMSGIGVPGPVRRPCCQVRCRVHRARGWRFGDGV